jgi:hypothetical protein
MKSPLRQAAENVVKVACAEHVTCDRICRIAQQVRLTPEEATVEVLTALCRGYIGQGYVKDTPAGDWDLIGRIAIGVIRTWGTQPEQPLIYLPTGVKEFIK